MSAAASRMAAKVSSSATRVAQASRPAPVMTSVFGLAGYHFGTKPTSSSSEAAISMAEGKSPWQDENAEKSFKYQYHPGGDKSKSPKVAPSALRSTIVPNVTLTKV
ncbi:MAG: hypothetical protein Q9167_006495 [Letrouitia subvulpina]